jgi:hypothetical protein
VRPVLEEPAVVPQQAVDLTRVVRAEAAPQDEPLAPRDDVRRVHLQPAEALDDLEDRARARVG